MSSAYMRKRELMDELERVSQLLPQRTRLLLIGGAPMVFREQKDGTIDIDIVALSERDKTALENAVRRLGYLKKGKMRFENPVTKFRIEVDIGKFIRMPISSRMLDRAERRHLKNLELLLLSNEDNIMFKSMTERERDVEDIQKIISSTKIDWNIIYEETKRLTEEEILKKGLNETTLYPAFVAVKLREVKDKYNLIEENIISKLEDSASDFMERSEQI